MKENNDQIQGICCECQTKHPVVLHPDIIEIFDKSNEQHYIMLPHKMFGNWCEGAFTIPQALVK